MSENVSIHSSFPCGENSREALKGWNRKVFQDDEDFKITVFGDLPKGDTDELLHKIKILMASGATEKGEDWDRISRKHLPDISLITHTIAVEDSEEEEPCAVDIALAKIRITLNDSFAELSQREQDKALSSLGIDDLTYALGMAEDRFLNLDPRLKDYHEFQAYKSEPLLAEVFEEGATFPGHRIKELSTAMGGPVEFVMALNRAYKALPKIDPVKYANLNKHHESGIAVAFKPLKSGAIPMSEEGVVIEVVSKKNRYATDIEAKLQELAEQGKSHDIDLGHFEYPDDQQESTAELRLNTDNDFFETDFIAAKAWEVFARVYNVPLRASPRSDHPYKIQNPNVLSDTDLKPKDLDSLGKETSVVRLPEEGIDSLAQLEESAIATHATVLKGPNFNDNGLRRDPLMMLIKRVETMLRFSSIATLKTVFDPFHYGAPMLLHESLRRDIMPLLKAVNNRKAASLKPSMICDFYESAAELENRLVWSPKYRDPESLQMPSPYLLKGEDEMYKILGIEKPDFALYTTGSASLNLPIAMEDGEYIGFEAAKHNMTLINGGSSRNIMAAPTYGAARAYKEGHSNFNVIGVREESISAREGGVARFQRETGFDFTKGTVDDEYFRLSENFHFMVEGNLASRQHLILGAGDAGIELAGGHGSNYENLGVSLSNLYILQDNKEDRPPEEQRNFFPGFDRKIRPQFTVNSRINGRDGNRYWGHMNEVFTPDEMDMMERSFHKDGKSAFQAALKFAQQRPLG